MAQSKNSIKLEIVEVNQQSVCLRIDSSLSVSYEGEWEAFGLSMADALTLPDTIAKIRT